VQSTVAQSDIDNRFAMASLAAIGRVRTYLFFAREKFHDKGDIAVYPLSLLLLFASGATALIYQVLWIKQLALVVGIDVHAVTTVVSAFFAGLGGGSWLFGRRADRSANSLRLYALLESGTALLAIAVTVALAYVAPLFVALETRIGYFAFALLFILVGLPALLMGGVLPALYRVCAPATERIGRSGGRLYASNTFGAVCGALLTPFLLIPHFGVIGAAITAAMINAALALFAFAWSFEHKVGAAATHKYICIAPSQKKRALILYAVAGAIALGYEVIWSQAVAQFMSTRSFAFAVMLATYLTGIALGSAIYARYADRVRNAWGIFAVLISGAGCCALLQIALLGNWLPQWQHGAAAAIAAISGQPLLSMSARFFIASAAVLLLPCLLLGAAFPAALRLTVDEGYLGRDTGTVIAVNTLGGIIGTGLTGFVFVPLFGLVHALQLLALSALLIGAIAMLGDYRAHSQITRAHWLFGAIALATLALVIVLPADRFAQLLRAARGGELVAYEESAGGTVAVLQQGNGSQTFNRLYIQGVSNSGDSLPSRRYMRLQALLPLLIQANEPRSALVIALGTGITAGALTQYPGLERRVCVELLPAVVNVADQFRGNYDVVHSPAVELRMRDGRYDLLRSGQRYDFITLEPPPPSAASVVNLYSRDFYQLARARLQPAGLFAQWLPLATQNNEDTRALVRSFLDVFPNASLWTTELHEMLLIGSLQPLVLDGDRIAARFAQPQVTAALSEIGITSPAALLATWVTGRSGLEQYASDAEPVTDNHPRIEYAGWLRPGEFARVLPQLLALHSRPPLRASAELRAQIDDERERLLRFYQAGLYAYRGDRDGWRRAINDVLEKDGGNVYYRWFAGGN
jgi:predicted membrane-bound spermidine synthase